MTFVELVQDYFGCAPNEVEELKESMTAAEWRDFVAQVRQAKKNP